MHQIQGFPPFYSPHSNPLITQNTITTQHLVIYFSPLKVKVETHSTFSIPLFCRVYTLIKDTYTLTPFTKYSLTNSLTPLTKYIYIPFKQKGYRVFRSGCVCIFIKYYKWARFELRGSVSGVF